MTDWKEFEMRMSGSLFDRADPKQLAPPNFDILKNCEFSKRGALIQRSGKRALTRIVKQPTVTPSLPNITAGSAVVGFGDRLLMCDGKSAYEWSEENDTWREVGFMSSADIRSDRINFESDTVISGTSTYANGYTAHASVVTSTSGLVNNTLTLVDESNGSVVYDSYVLGTHSSTITEATVFVRSMALGTNIIIATLNAAKQIQLYSVQTAVVGIPIATGFVSADAFTGSANSPAFDMAPISATGGALVYRTSAIQIKAVLINTLGAASGGGVVSSTTADGQVAVIPDAVSSRVYVMYVNTGTDISGVVYNATLTAILFAPIPVIFNARVIKIAAIHAPSPLANAFSVFYQYNLIAGAIPPLPPPVVAPVPRPAVAKADISFTGFYSVLSTAGLGFCLRMGSKPFSRGNNQYLVMDFFRTTQSAAAGNPINLYDGTALLVRTEWPTLFGVTSDIIAVADAGFYSNSYPGDVAVLDSDTFKIPRDRASGVFGKFALSSITVDFRKRNGTTSGIVGQNLAICGSQLYQFDGERVFENGPYYYPKYTHMMSTVALSGTFPSGGTYQVAVIYKYIDVNGNSYVSGFFQTTYTPTNASRAIILEVDILRTARRNSYIEVYVSQANLTTLYLGTTGGATPVPARFPNAENIAGTGIAAVSVTAPPTGTEPVLYTTGGVIKNSMVPSPTVIHVHDSRLFAIVNGRDLYYSKKFVTGEGLSMSSILSFPLPTEAGMAIAMESIDDNLAISHETSTYLQSGEGPNALGVGVFNGPQKILVDIGCDKFSAPSLVKTNSGLLFKSKKGFYTLGRDFSASRIDQITRFEEEAITSATLLRNKSQIRINNASPATLVWDYLEGRWGQFDAEDSVSSAVYGDKYAHMGLDGIVYVEDDTGSQIATPIVLEFSTGWVNLAGIQGYERIRRFGINIQDQTGVLVVDVYYDYDDLIIGETFSYPAMTTGNRNIRQRLGRQRAQAIKFHVVHSALPPSAKISVTSMMLELGMIRGIYRRNG